MIDSAAIAILWIFMVLGVLGAIAIPFLAAFICYVAYTDNKENGWVYRSLDRMIAQEAAMEKKMKATNNWRELLC